MRLACIPRVSQLRIIHRARLSLPDISAGPESAEVALFEWDRIPWDEIAFPSVRRALEHHRELGADSASGPFTNPPGETGNL